METSTSTVSAYCPTCREVDDLATLTQLESNGQWIATITCIYGHVIQRMSFTIEKTAPAP